MKTPPSSPDLKAWKPLILVVDDHPINQQMAIWMLESQGCFVHVVASGTSAVQIIRNRDFDLILMDCHMPLQDGFETAVQIRKLGPTKASIPIIAMTASTSEVDREKCITSGMHDFLPKPISNKELGRILNQWLGLPEKKVSPTPLSEGVIFDSAALKRMLGANTRGESLRVQNLIRLFIDSSEASLSEIHRLLNAEDPTDLLKSIHAFKGSCLTLGAIEMYENLVLLEKFVQESDGRSTNSAYPALEKALVLTKKFLAAFVEQFQPA